MYKGDPTPPCDNPNVGNSDDSLTAVLAALRTGDAAAARALLDERGDAADHAAVLELRARASYLDLAYTDAIEQWEQAYAAHREAGDSLAAVRVARSLACMYGTVFGDGAVMNGWMARAQTLLAGTESVEAGWIALDLGMFEGDRSRKNELFREAVASARRFGDDDLQFVALAYLGASLVHADRTEEGMMLLDEALAAVAGSDVDDFIVLQEIFCQLFSACEYAHDVARADQWIRIGDVIAKRRNLPAVSAYCRTHYGGILTAAGRWPEADEALVDAVRLWGLGHRMLRGGALVRLADLRVRQGRFEEAEQLLDGTDVAGDAIAAHAMAAIRLANREIPLARDVIERALAQIDVEESGAGPLLALLVDVHLAANEPDEAESAARLLVDCAKRHPNDHYLRAAAALARGRVCLVRGTGDPHACLREALSGFAQAQMPLELAHSRLALANALLTERPEVALVEARAALDAFDRLHAARAADEAAAVLRSLGARSASTKKTAGLLTKREEEVLDLLGRGMSNPEIADRLFISRKTVEHHVGNVLAKLGLKSRGEAAAYAMRVKSGGE